MRDKIINSVDRIQQEIRIYESAKENMSLSREDRDYAETQIKKLSRDLEHRNMRVHSDDMLMLKAYSLSNAKNNENKITLTLPVSYCMSLYEILGVVNGFVNNTVETPNATEAEMHSNINIAVAQSGFAYRDKEFETEGEVERDTLGKDFIEQINEEIRFALQTYDEEEKERSIIDP